MASHDEKLHALSARRWVVGGVLTALMTLVYFGFLLMVAYQKEFLGKTVVPGLSWGILLAAGVIVFAWLVTFIYVQWANNRYDPALKQIREEGRRQ